MAISTSVDVVQAALWPQGDARDPLGVWGARLGITGDASGGGIKGNFRVPADRKSAYVYTVYSLTAVQLTGTPPTGQLVKSRILTNWPDFDPLAGVQSYSTASFANLVGLANLTAPTSGAREFDLTKPNDRFLLCFDPRPIGGALDIVEIVWSENVDLATYSFEGYGYFWDRAVMNTPGGPRHPGSS